MAKEIVDRVRAMADPILLNEGMELVEVEYRRESKGWVLRLTSTRREGSPSMIALELARKLEGAWMWRTSFRAPYTLEVSSPGLTRPLKSEKDFMKYRNRLIKVKTLDPIDNRQQFKGKLLGVSENQIEMEMEEGIIQIPLSKMAKANLEIDQTCSRRSTL